MLEIACQECASVGSYRATPGVFFRCLECRRELTTEDLDLDPGEIWVVSATGILGFVIDPVESIREMSIATDAYLGAECDSLDELEALRSFHDAAFRLQGALKAGVPYPIMET
ncbi:hypothetical protein [Streptomyces sp. NRRL S-350]|uniref:hypothetical protein n=1 Tax=Streptomyces sp. NRRL S-350 TaxID=1463902 RepID=UPI00131EAA05|nr:hypothetical protein [Streptomyces sp. NRRL S-350]